MSKISWLWDRWRIMQHPQEEIYRIRQLIQYFYKDRKWAKHPPLPTGFRWKRLLSNYFLADDLKNIVTSTFSDIHSFRILNVLWPDIVHHDNWNYDVKNHIACEKRFVHNIDDDDYSYGEVKYVYELSRLYQFVPLVSYYVAQHDLQGIHDLKTTLKQWYAQNPYMYNIAWKSGNVVGIRAVNLIIFKSILDLLDKDDDFDRFFADLIELHYRFLVSHQSLYSSKGNHHIGELAGLIAIAATFTFENSDKYLRKYFKELQSEVLRLIYDDGMNKEQAVRYQASYINLIMMSLMFAEHNGIKPDNKVYGRMQAAYAFLAAMKVRPKYFLQVGDNDDAQLIYPYPDIEFDIYESMMNDYGVLYEGVLDDSYHFDLRNYVLLGHDGYRAYVAKDKSKFSITTVAHLYKNSGYYVYSDQRRNILFDVGPIGLLPTMSHGHSDILSFQVYYEGIPVIVDTGAYQYNRKYRKLRDYFHGVHSHNTIAVNDMDQAMISNGMFWLSNPNVYIEEYSEDPMRAFCKAYHTGYVRGNVNIRHYRHLAVQPDTIIISDDLIGNSGSWFTFYLHFHPDIDVCLNDDKLLLSHDGKSIMYLESTLFHMGHLVKGDTVTPMGWYSPSYDNIVETTSFVLRCDILQTKQVETIIHFL